MTKVSIKAIDQFNYQAVNQETGEVEAEGSLDYVQYCLLYEVNGKPQYQLIPEG